MNKNKAVTIKDIARACGVSIVTVSRVLSGTDYPVKNETREKILKTAKELNYQPNLFARGLKTKAFVKSFSATVASTGTIRPSSFM